MSRVSTHFMVLVCGRGRDLGLIAAEDVARCNATVPAAHKHC